MKYNGLVLCVISIVLALVVGSCSSRNSAAVVPSSTIQHSQNAGHDVFQPGNGVQFVEFALPQLSSGPTAIAVHPKDSRVYFTEYAGNRIASITQSGTITESTIPTPQSGPKGIAIDVNGGAWFTEFSASKIGYMSSPGHFVEYPLLSRNSGPAAILIGPDKNIWFTETNANKIGQLTHNGTLTEFPIPTAKSAPTGLTVGSDGNLWFVESQPGKIAKITASGQITEFSSGPAQFIASAGDGNLWFTDPTDDRIGKITTGGAVTTYPLPTGSTPWGICKGPDGNAWFVNIGNNSIQSFDRVSKSFTPPAFIPTQSSTPRQIVAAADGNLWFTESKGNNIGVFLLKRLAVIPSSLTFSQIGQTQIVTAVESDYSGSFSASTSNSHVATVVPYSGGVSFAVTSTGVGSATVTVVDTSQNSAGVPVIVQSSPSPSPSPSPTATPPTLTLGNANIATGGTVVGGFTYTPASFDTIIFTCGCSNQAGITTADAGGSFTAASPASPTPAVPNPTYTIVPGRNYLIVAEPPASNAGPQGWTMLFAGTVVSHDLALGDEGSVAASAGTSDVYTTALALLIYKQSIQNSNTAFDDWNFNALQGWLARMVTAPTPQETTLLNQIASSSAADQSLFPTTPGWNALQVLNPTINTDLTAVIANPGTATPTPCPGGQGGCTGTPTP